MTDRVPIHALDPAGATDGQVPSYDVATGRVVWADPGAGSGTTDLDALTDVDTTTTPPTSGQVLKFDGAQWVPGSDATGSGGAAGGANYEGTSWPIDAPPTTPNAMDDEFDGTSLSAIWTPTRGTTAAPTVTVADGMLAFDAAAEAGWKIQGLTQPLPPSGDWTFVLAIAAADSPPGNYVSPALIGLAEGASGATGKIQVCGMTNFSGSTIQIAYGASWSAFSSSPYNEAVLAETRDGYFKVAKVGTTYTWSYSRTGKKWWTLLSGSLAFTPGRVVIGGKSENASISPQGLFKWFRRTA